MERDSSNSFYHFSFHLNNIKATQTLSDRAIEIDPGKAVAWFLDFEATIQSILRLGDRNTSLGRDCFNTLILGQICECLPYILRDRTTNIKEDGRERLVKVIGMVAKDRHKIERRALDENNLYFHRWYDGKVTSRFDVTQEVPDTTITSRIDVTQEVPDTIVTSMVDIAHEVPDITPSLTRTSNSLTSRHDSWTLLCLDTDT